MNERKSSGWAAALFKFIRSVKLAIVLILIITFTSIISTLIPQNKDLAFYTETYSRITSWLILTSGVNSFFKSCIFIVPSVFFFINLSVCTFDRLKGRIKRKAKKRFGPDILHIGLLILIIGGMITFMGRTEAFVTMEEGDTISLTGGYTLALKSFDFLKYENGRPKDWISTVELEKDGQIIHDSFAIEVNRPLKAGNKKIYQTSYTVNNELFISDPEGSIYRLKPGQMIPVGEDGLIFSDVIADPSGSGDFVAIFEEWVGREVQGRVTLSVSDKIDIYTISGIDSQLSTGLQIVSDPGYYTVLIGLILLTIGLFLTYYQKLGDDKL
ncbi:MAG: cytochrome c biogenesis protein ResB [Spirochaetales bacterium]|nr:cytochrome c biogenesis protein ResB [Spirochaetales bacterium]